MSEDTKPAGGGPPPGTVQSPSPKTEKTEKRKSEAKAKIRKLRRRMRNRPEPMPKVPLLPPEVTHAKLAAGATRITQQLPQMGPMETVRIWSNSVKLLDSPSPEMRASAWQVLKAIEDVWRVRANDTPKDWFPWPKTAAVMGRGGLDTHGWEPEGMLKFLGYSVGVKGESHVRRRSILRQAFEGVLPPVFPPNYMLVWSRPSSAQRLHKMAESIASFTRSAKRRDDNRLEQAIAEWEADLDYLRETFYVGRFQFGWPSSLIDSLDRTLAKTGAGTPRVGALRKAP